MSVVSTRVKRLLLRSIYWTLETEQGETLLSLLKAAAQSRVADSLQGKVLVSTTGNGHQVSYLVTDDSITPSETLELVSELLDRYDEAVTALGASTGGGDDTEIYAEMLARLVAVRTVTNDYAYLRDERAAAS